MCLLKGTKSFFNTCFWQREKAEHSLRYASYFPAVYMTLFECPYTITCLTNQRYPCDNGCNLCSLWSTSPVKSSTIITIFPLLKLKISWFSESSVIFERRDQLVHKIAWCLSQSVDLKKKKQAAVLNNKSSHQADWLSYSWIKKWIRNVVCAPQPHLFE